MTFSEQLRALLVATTTPLTQLLAFAKTYDLRRVQWYVTHRSHPTVLFYQLLERGPGFGGFDRQAGDELRRLLNAWLTHHLAVGHDLPQWPLAQRIWLDVRTGALTVSATLEDFDGPYWQDIELPELDDDD